MSATTSPMTARFDPMSLPSPSTSARDDAGFDRGRARRRQPSALPLSTRCNRTAATRGSALDDPVEDLRTVDTVQPYGCHPARVLKESDMEHEPSQVPPAGHAGQPLAGT